VGRPPVDVKTSAPPRVGVGKNRHMARHSLGARSQAFRERLTLIRLPKTAHPGFAQVTCEWLGWKNELSVLSFWTRAGA
jgi:hypothetical protein